MKYNNIFIFFIIIFCLLLGYYVYSNYFAWEPSPRNVEYLQANSFDINLQNDVKDNKIEKDIKLGKVENYDNKDIILEDFSKETVGARPVSFAPAVGNWIIGVDNNNKVLVVDGRSWSRGKPATGLADKARALYGDRYAEFLDNVKAYAYYPFAVFQQVDNFSNGEISIHFKGVAGRIDQGAGILFDLKNNGDYYAVRANPLENNLVLWRFKHGKRSSVSWVRNVFTPSLKWHELKIVIKGSFVECYVNSKLFMKYNLPDLVSGKIGVWTKADSVVFFDDYKVVLY